MLNINDFNNVQFIKSIASNEQIPQIRLPEIAFSGRSNVGKSSLLNSIFNRKNLVKTSSTPGKTQLINYFNVNEQIYCVDLPGYGFAKVPKAEKIKWQSRIENYLIENSYLKHIFLLVDSRHELMNIDKEMIEWLNFSNLRFTVILSKVDKLSKKDKVKSIMQFSNYLKGITILPFSIKEKQSVAKLKEYIIKIIS